MLRLWTTTIALAAAMTVPAVAYDYKDYMATHDELEVQAYLQGVGEGLGWAIAFTDDPHPKLFCAPDDKAHDRAEYIQILDSFETAHPDMQEYPVEMVLLLALQEKYPC
jgi:hypothetical protein